jgi:iron complex outermembrane receptor protein
MVGQWWLRVPRTRASVQASYRLGDSTLAASWRHQGRAYNDPYNQDLNPNVYGGVSSLNQLDLRATHKLSRHLTGALGVNNATDRAAYQAHPYPGRTLFAELRFTL